MKRLNSCILAVSLMMSAALVQASEMQILGGLIGGAIGASVGKQVGGSEGAVIGAAIGGLTGVAIADNHRETRVVEREVIEVREPRVVEHHVIREEYRPAPRVVYVERQAPRVVYVEPRHSHHRHDHRRWDRDYDRW